MKEISKQDWTSRIAPYHFPNQFSDTLKLAFDKWQDPKDPLGSLLEVIKFSMLAPFHGIRADVFAGQIFHESQLGLHEECLLGIKARAQDIADGKAVRLRTLEILQPKDIAKLKASDPPDFIENVGDPLPDGRQEIRCYQMFYADSFQGNFERYFEIYEKHPERLAHLSSAADFLGNVTEKFYATGLNYARAVMGHIQEFKLDQLVLAPSGPAALVVD